MIYTFTINPSLDYIVHLNDIKIGVTNRSEKEEMKVGGKGINVSIVLNNLGVKSIASGILGGFTGDFIEKELTENYQYIRSDFIKSDQPTRINVKIKGSQETEINGRGAEVNDDLEAEVLAKIKQIKEGSIVCISGSIEQEPEKNLYRDIAKILKQKQVEFVIDNASEKIVDVLTHRPLLLKPNKAELSLILGKQMDSEEELIAGGKVLIDKGAKNVIISLGGEGAIFLNEEHCILAKPPSGKLVNSVGSGDSMVAGFLASYIKRMNMKECFRSALAAGTATAYSNDLATKEKIKEIYQQVKLIERM